MGNNRIGTKTQFELDETELAVRIFEATTGNKRPIGMSAKSAFFQLDAVQKGQALLGAKAAIAYFQEQFTNRKTLIING
jgi:hypothetical protein